MKYPHLPNVLYFDSSKYLFCSSSEESVSPEWITEFLVFNLYFTSLGLHFIELVLFCKRKSTPISVTRDLFGLLVSNVLISFFLLSSSVSSHLLAEMKNTEMLATIMNLMRIFFNEQMTETIYLTYQVEYFRDFLESQNNPKQLPINHFHPLK